MRHKAGLAAYQVFFEYRAHVLADTLLDQVAGKMCTADQSWIGRMTHGTLKCIGDAMFFQVMRNSHGTFAPACLYSLKPGLQCGMTGIDIEANHVKCYAAPGHGYFHALNKTNAEFISSAFTLLEAANIVMIREGKHIHAHGSRSFHKFARIQDAVGNAGMAVEIEIHHLKYREIIAK